MNQIRVMRNTRVLVERAIEGLTEDQLLAIPRGSRNNILWNLGHLIVTQQTLQYRLSGLPMLVSDELVAQFGAGSSPADWTTTPNVDELRGLLRSLPDRFEEDYEAGRFAGFQGFTTKSTGFEMATIEAVTDFVVFHDGLHLGVIQAYRKVLG